MNYDKLTIGSFMLLLIGGYADRLRSVYIRSKCRDINIQLDVEESNR